MFEFVSFWDLFSLIVDTAAFVFLFGYIVNLCVTGISELPSDDSDRLDRNNLIGYEGAIRYMR